MKQLRTSALGLVTLLACTLAAVAQPPASELQPPEVGQRAQPEHGQRAQPAVRYPLQYAAKILCTANIPGTSQTTGSLLPGVYQTVVNLHNPNAEPVRLRKKIATGLGISQFVTAHLEPDGFARVDCQEITQGFGGTFIHGAEGFLVIESTHPLDVIAVYTAGKRGGEVESIDVEKVGERKLR